MKLSSTSSQIAEALQSEMLRGELPAFTPLRQAKIADQFGVSKIPVREALLKLEADGLVSFLPNGSAIVSGLTPAEASEIYLLRIEMEKLLLRTAFPHLAEVDFVKAENSLRLINYETETHKWSELNWAFHEVLYMPASLPLILSQLKKYYINVARYFVNIDDLVFRERTQTEHLTILDACRAGNLTNGCQILENHLQIAGKALVAYLETHQ